MWQGNLFQISIHLPIRYTCNTNGAELDLHATYDSGEIPENRTRRLIKILNKQKYR